MGQLILIHIHLTQLCFSNKEQLSLIIPFVKTAKEQAKLKTVSPQPLIKMLFAYTLYRPESTNMNYVPSMNNL